MQATISIPQHWAYPRFALEQRTQDGIILGFYYYPNGTELAEQFDEGWCYVLMPKKNSDEISYLQENQIQPLSPQELFTQITAEIDFYQQQIAILQQQLAIVTGGFTNA
ncbi:hypothetical protein [Nostoc sp. 'Peltigera membranacea cyanobiont' N6]|uniref:hypothetical protein n=1 Tax=Nostoc sp. 'Peltigera membranacea cyanobiont' N6 TaxID=1261031 RepID=UPI000CF34E2D|nr:hypothetical protein [Nostoc sp. 'Peltigera membranacea cyanobiont' N6]AVH63870.1 hypothetical protein NPM_2132 [Nostoc sp. 'Peltigera membranacea cyanobiont' N6]